MTDQTRREFLAATGGALASTSLAALEPRAAEPVRGTESSAIPPHRPLSVAGIHAYTDRVSVAAGDMVSFHVSSSYPYELTVCRLGLDVDSPAARDEILHSFGHSPAAVQPIHPGSYLIVDPSLDAETSLPALTLEVWIRRWRTTGRQAIIAQFDQPRACGFGLFVNEDGSLSFYLGDGGDFVQIRNMHSNSSRPTPDGRQSGGTQALPGQYAQLGAFQPVASCDRAV